MNTQTTDSLVPGNNVRKYLDYGLAHWLRRAYTLWGVNTIGKKVHIDHNVRVLRHPENLHLGSNVLLKEGTRICPTNPKASITIGDNTTIGYHTFLFASGSITIGRNCLIAPFCYFVDANHGITLGNAIKDQPLTIDPIVVGEGVWIGAGTTILPGTRIGNGAVVGANSTVRGNILPNEVVAGSPAIFIKSRM